MGLSITSKITGFFGLEEISIIPLKDGPNNLLDCLEFFKGFLSNYDKKILENLLKSIQF